MIRILDASKDLAMLVLDRTNGLGQFEPLSCLVTEELNGIYEAEITVSSTDKHFNDLSVGGIVKIPVNESGSEQMFRIYYISKPMNQVVTLKCQHISYDLNKIAVKPFTATGASQAVQRLHSNMVGTYPFMITTDMANTTSVFTLDIPRSFRECLGGYEGSLLDTFRGEYEYDNLEVKMLTHRGSDTDVRISYGKNLTDFTQEENIENVYTSVLGYATVDGVTYTGNVYHKVQTAYPKVKIVDFTEDYQGGESTIPTTEELTAKAQQYAERNSIEVPRVNIQIEFVPLYQTEEYKNIAPLERVFLGDTVHVYFDKLGVEASSRVVKTVWNANLNRYNSVELGDTKANMNTLLNEVTEESNSKTTQSQGFLEAQMNQMASLIINGLGLHKTLVQAEGGGYKIYLHNKETLADSDTQYIFTSEGFLVSTDYGRTWNAGFDSEGNAVVNSLSTITLKALEIYGSYIEGATLLFGDPEGQNIMVSPIPTGIAFDGSGFVRMATVGGFAFNNKDSNDTILNNLQIYANSDGTKGILMHNYETVGSSPWYQPNSLGMQVTSDSYQFNIGNGQYSDVTKSGNSISLTTNAAQNTFLLANNNYGATTNGNFIQMTSNSSLNWLQIQQSDASGNKKAEIFIEYDKSANTSHISLNADNISINGHALTFSSGYVRYN